MRLLKQRLEDMCKGLKDLGAEMGDMQLPDLQACELSDRDKNEMDTTGHVVDDSEEKSSGS